MSLCYYNIVAPVRFSPGAAGCGRKRICTAHRTNRKRAKPTNFLQSGKLVSPSAATVYIHYNNMAVAAAFDLI